MADTSAPKVNPALEQAVTKVLDAVKQAGARAVAMDAGAFPVLAAVFAVVLLIGVLVWRFVYAPPLESPETLRSRAKAATLAQAHYSVSAPNRKGMADYLTSLQTGSAPVSDAELVLGNFYISTANATGMFLPARDGVVTPEAARAAVLAGARAFVFDIWPDLTPGANFAPILQAVEEGSSWRRITFNSLPFATVLRDLIQEALALPERPGYNDPVLLYLRFRGSPRSTTYAGVAAALQAIIEPYRMDAPYYNCRAQQRLFAIPLRDLARKVLVFSNVRAQGTALADYINAGPMDGIKQEWTAAEVRTLSADGAVDAKRKIQQSITFVAPPSESAEAEASPAAPVAHALGIQCVAMNFWNPNDALKQYLAPTMFGVQSFAIKPAALRYRVESLPAAGVPRDPGIGTGALTTPAALQRM